MKHKTTKRFWDLYHKQPFKIQSLADKAFDNLKENPYKPALHFKKVGKLYSARINLSHRALAVKDGDDFIWVWLGNHDDYEKLIK